MVLVVGGTVEIGMVVVVWEVVVTAVVVTCVVGWVAVEVIVVAVVVTGISAVVVDSSLHPMIMKIKKIVMMAGVFFMMVNLRRRL